MTVQLSQNSPDVHRSRARSIVLPLAATVVVGAVCAWSTSEAAAADQVPMICFGAAAAVLLGVLLALSAGRSRAARLQQARIDAVRSEAALAAVQQTEAVRHAALDADTARRTAWDAQAERQAALDSEAAARAALEAEQTRSIALQARIDQMHAEADQFAVDADHLAEQTIHQAVKQLRDGASVETVLAQAPAHLEGPHLQILRTLVTEVGTSERMRSSGMAACANAAGRVQALATSMLADLREMENRHSEEVLGDLLRLDHGTAQAGRLADSIAVLTGSRSGRRWTKPIMMESVLRGAMGRISAYQRVRLHSASTVAVAGYAAEGVMHALAELMDNATTFSPPTEEVHVYVQEMHSGVVVTIEDGGLVMPAATLSRAEQLVSNDPLDLMTLSGTRLGLAVVGCLARKHGLTVSFRPSSRGGTGVVVLIPQQLISRAREQHSTGRAATQDQARRTSTTAAAAAAGTRTVTPATTPPAAAARPGRTPMAAAVPPDDASSLFDASDTELPPNLPKRRRGETLAASLHPTATPVPVQDEEADARSRRGAGARFAAFQASARTEAEAETGTEAGFDDSPSAPAVPVVPQAPPAQNGQDTDR